jgi:ribonuclease D
VAQEAGFRRTSLQALSTLLLGHSISKKQQCSNWNRVQLTQAQVVYAATDAWASREVAVKLAPLWLQQDPSATPALTADRDGLETTL